MEESKTAHLASNNVKFLSAFFSASLAVCFVTLIHVEIELRAHRQMLEIVNQGREESIELRNIVGRHEKTIDSMLKTLHGGSPEGNY